MTDRATLQSLIDLKAEITRLEVLVSPRVDCYPCQRCGRRDGLDAVVTDEEWRQINTGQWEWLCLWCMDALALEVGLSTGVRLYFAGRALHADGAHALNAAGWIAARLKFYTLPRSDERSRLPASPHRSGEIRKTDEHK